MFKKILIANRGEIAVRIIRTCRDMGISTVTLYHPRDIRSLHVRLADEAVRLRQTIDQPDAYELLDIAERMGVDAIHPGYGFGAERYDFARPVEKAGFTFVGPPSGVIRTLTRKAPMLEQARAAGIPTPLHSPSSYSTDDIEGIAAAAEELGYPVVIKSRRGGRGPGVRVVTRPEKLERLVRVAAAEAQAVYLDSRIYLEKAIFPAYHVDVQILADQHGHVVHLGERSSSLQQHNQKIVSETPAPCISEAQRRRVLELAVEIARLFEYQNAGTVEFLIDSAGEIYFSDFKARIQVEHPINEMVTGIDIVREQLRIAAAEPLGYRQEDIAFKGWSMQCRINAEDPWNNFLPSPGHLNRFRLPAGLHVRVDTYGYTGCDITTTYDSMLAKLIVWGEDRETCIKRMRRALQDFIIQGIPTNVALHQGVLNHPDFLQGNYDTEFIQQGRLHEVMPEENLRDLAVAAAIAYMRRTNMQEATLPTRLQSGWHRSSRRVRR